MLFSVVAVMNDFSSCHVVPLTAVCKCPTSSTAMCSPLQPSRMNVISLDVMCSPPPLIALTNALSLQLLCLLPYNPREHHVSSWVVIWPPITALVNVPFLQLLCVLPYPSLMPSPSCHMLSLTALVNAPSLQLPCVLPYSPLEHPL